jgi:hypothetical protein
MSHTPEGAEVQGKCGGYGYSVTWLSSVQLLQQNTGHIRFKNIGLDRDVIVYSWNNS